MELAKNWVDLLTSLHPKTPTDLMGLTLNPTVTSLLDTLKDHGDFFLHDFERMLKARGDLEEVEISSELKVAKSCVGALFGNQFDVFQKEVEDMEEEERIEVLKGDVHNTSQILLAITKSYRVMGFMQFMESLALYLEGDLDVFYNDHMELSLLYSTLCGMGYASLNLDIIPKSLHDELFRVDNVAKNSQEELISNIKHIKTYAENAINIFQRKFDGEDTSIADNIIKAMMKEKKETNN